jgi:hypothetical protein
MPSGWMRTTSAALARHGYRIIRFWNNDVLDNLDGVLVRRALEVPPPLPASPPPRAERRRSRHRPSDRNV